MKKKPTYEELEKQIQDFDEKIENHNKLGKSISRENHNLNTLLDNIPGCIALILKKGSREIVASNKLAKELGAVPGRSCFRTCLMQDRDCPWCLAHKLWETGQSQKSEFESNGIWYEAIWEPFSEDLYVHYIFDITSQKFPQNLALAQLDLSYQLSHVDTLEKGLNACLQAALLVSDLDCGAIYLFDKKSGTLDQIIHRGLSKDFLKSTSRYEKKSDNTMLIMQGNPTYTTHQQLELFLSDAEKKEELQPLYWPMNPRGPIF